MNQTQYVLHSKLEEIRKLPSAEQLSALTDFCESIPDNSERLTTKALLLSALSTGTPLPPPEVVVLIHGISSYGEWHLVARQAIERYPTKVVAPLSYPFVNKFEFLFREKKRLQAVNQIKTQFEDLINNRAGSTFSIVAHSFGTYIVSKLLEESDCVDGDSSTAIRKIVPERLLLCGSIIPRFYKWNDLPSKMGSERIVNDVGIRDWLPVAAKYCANCFGPSGTFGFGNLRITDRFFNYNHSEFFEGTHIKDYWVPFLINGEIVHPEYTLKSGEPCRLIRWADKVSREAFIVLFGALLLAIVYAIFW